MMNSPAIRETPAPVMASAKTVYPILFAISFAHLLNDTMQAVIASIYPLLKVDFHLSFAQIGLVTLCYQITASLLQPFVGLYTDKNPKPFSIAAGMGFSLIGVFLWRASYSPLFRYERIPGSAVSRGFKTLPIGIRMLSAACFLSRASSMPRAALCRPHSRKFTL